MTTPTEAQEAEVLDELQIECTEVAHLADQIIRGQGELQNDAREASELAELDADLNNL